LPDALAASNIGSPAIIVVGDVVRCATQAIDLDQLAQERLSA
jgi:siroheme synthase